jgi:hypothetical protein
MEIEGLNNMDELVPYDKNQYTRTNSGNSGIVNSAFAKIPISNQDSLTLPPFARIIYPNYYYFNPPAERIKKIRIKLREHNGQLLDLTNSTFSFLLEFTLYKPQIEKKYSMFVPETTQFSYN